MVEQNQASADPTQQVLQALNDAILAGNQEEALFDGLSLLCKLVENKVKNPEEAKFNKFKKTNAKVAGKILSLQGGINDFIIAMGFSVNSSDEYEFTGDLKTLKKGLRIIEASLEPSRVARMTPEERTKHELL